MHDGMQWREPDEVLVTNASGMVEGWIKEAEAGLDIQYFEGLLCPGFINAHCHLELSHLKGHIPPRCGMVPFIQQVMQLKRFRPQEKEAAMMEALREMRNNGIVAVGDISNTTDSIVPKSTTDIRFHHFIEISGFVPATTEDRFLAGAAVAEAFREAFPNAPVTITPHAPYSVAPVLLQNLQEYAAGNLLSFHLMESEEELNFFRDKQGDFMQLYAQLGIRLDFFEAPGKNPLRHLWPVMKSHKPWLLVHNTEVGLHDLEWLDAQGADWSKLHWCLCPGANQYINYTMPAIHRFRHQYPLQLCLGTDSLAGNYFLNPLYEMRLLQKQGKLHDLGYLIEMATLNGAKALGMEDKLGDLSKGKNPGLLHLTGLEEDNITPKSKTTRLL